MTPHQVPPADSKPPVHIRFWRALFSWRTVRRLLVALAILVTLLAAAYTFESWRGKRAWLRFKAEWEAKGERFDLAAFIPNPVPPDQNFAATPFFAPLFDYVHRSGTIQWRDSNAVARVNALRIDLADSRSTNQPGKLGNWPTARPTDLTSWHEFYRGNTNYPSPAQSKGAAEAVLNALASFDPVLTELQQASRRPASVFPSRFSHGNHLYLPAMGTLKALTQVTSLRATANLSAGRAEEALSDITLALRLGDSIKTEALLISQLVRISLLEAALNPVWEGLASGRWDERQLRELQTQLERIEILNDYPRTMRGERAFGNALLDELFTGKVSNPWEALGDPEIKSFARLGRIAPPGWLYQNQLNINRLHQEWSLRIFDPATDRFDHELAANLDKLPQLKRTTPYNILARMLFPAFAKSADKFARAQTGVHLARAATALERFVRDHGVYPENIELLTPKYLAKPPKDIMSGEPLKYRRVSTNEFLLYSIGANRKDDGGIVVTNKTGSAIDPTAGDWVWRYPQRKAKR